MVSSVEENSRGVSAELNCIDLSTPDIQNSVSLLKQVPNNYTYIYSCVCIHILISELCHTFLSYCPVWYSLAASRLLYSRKLVTLLLFCNS